MQPSRVPKLARRVREQGIQSWLGGGGRAPMNERNRPGSAEASLLALATDVFGVGAHAWLETPHQLLSGATPSAFAADGGTERVRSILLATQHGGVV
ncbi:DUF2384 domain-containing protein [Variovorax paradoxus]|nr:DUF2384 domain-containing protein [Variovorax paradoxus]